MQRISNHVLLSKTLITKRLQWNITCKTIKKEKKTAKQTKNDLNARVNDVSITLFICVIFYIVIL